MKRIFAQISVFVLFSFLTVGNALASSGDGGNNQTETLFSSDRPIFSTDTDLILGQRRRGVRIWSNIYFGATTLEPKEGGKIQPDYLGIQVGLDFPKSNGMYSTFFFNANQSDTQLDSIATSAIDTFQFGYGKYMYFDICHFAFNGSVAYDRYEVTGSGIASEGNGLQTNFFGEFGLDFIFGKWGIKPFYAMQYDFMYHGRIGEPTTSFAGDWNGHGLQQLLGLRLNWKVLNMLGLHGRTVWVHEFLGNPPPFYRGRFSPVHGTSTPAIMFYDGNTGRDWAWLGIGAKLEGIFGIYFFCDYDVLLNERHTSHLGSLGICINW